MLSEFSNITGISEADLTGNSRQANIVVARHVYWYLLNKSGLSLHKIAKIANRNSHASIYHGITSISDFLEIKDSQVMDIYNKTKHLLSSMSKVKTIIELHVPRNKDSMRTSFTDTARCEVCHGTGHIYYGGWMAKFKQNPDDPDDQPCPCCQGTGQLTYEVTINWTAPERG